MSDSHIDRYGLMRDVLLMEAKAIKLASQRLDSKNIDRLVDLFNDLIGSGSSLIFCGVGKSGLIGQKLASTFTSLGLPSHFLHPTEALHGDLGRIRASDAIVYLSKSGTTEEIVKLFPYLPMDNKRRVALVGNLSSPIAKDCGIVFDCSVEKEACLNNQAPTTSSTLALAMGDAMAVLFESLVELTKEKFAVNHPGGLLGKSLRVRVQDLMWDKNDCPVVDSSQSLRDVILEMTKIPVGGCAVCDERGRLMGIIVEGDIRRTFTKENSKGLETPVTEVMNPRPVSVNPSERAYRALELMEKRQREIHLLPVVSDEEFVGFIRLHDLLKEGFSIGV